MNARQLMGSSTSFMTQTTNPRLETMNLHERKRVSACNFENPPEESLAAPTPALSQPSEKVTKAPPQKRILSS